MIKTQTLSNGIKVLSYRIPQVKSIHIRASVKGGGFVETDKQRGTAHFMEHILLEGIPSFPTASKIAQHVESLAGTYNAFTDSLRICALLSVPYTTLDESLHMIREIIYEPLFSPKSIEKERNAIITEIQESMESPNYRLGKCFQYNVINNTKHNYFNENHIETLQKLTREELLDYWKTYFVPQNTYLLIVGNFEEKVLSELLEKYFATEPKGSMPIIYPPSGYDDFHQRNFVIRHDNELKENYVDIMFPSFSMECTTRDRIIQYIILYTLANSSTSRLFKLLRSKTGLVYGIGMNAGIFPKNGYVNTQYTVLPHNTEKVSRIVAEEVSKFISKGPTQKELDRAKHFFSNQNLMAFDHPGTIADWMEGCLLWLKNVETPEDHNEIILGITLEDMQTFMKTYWKNTQANIIMQGAIEESEEQKGLYKEIFKQFQSNT